MKEITTLGIDLAKNIFQLHGVDRHGKSVLKKAISRAKFLETLANIPPCLVGIEACGGAHHWAREIGKLGHQVRIIAPQFVSPYRKSGKNDANDSEAICEAVARPNMRFVAIKTPEQQAALVVHRAREAIKTERTALINQIRGLLQEFGIVLPQGAATFSKRLVEVLEDSGMPLEAVGVFAELRGHLLRLEERQADYDRRIARLAQDKTAQRLAEIPGVGPVTATAVVASVGDAKLFHNGRELAAWVGLVPKQSISGGKTRLGRITKHGDSYLRTLFVQGAMTVILHLGEKTDPRSQWIRNLVARRGTQKATVALAAKTVRTVWALMAREEHYRQAA
ncbi:IS110 family transposase [Acidithiobacillus ferrooxidans]|uniref:IS110 family transposase n=1 Tax=Acidithiobacillus ferrooxidans TaxID=920 RepID=UPI001C06F672|nr:IS110 family transposase [Acidithiobacillus ferrooxidans]MBU2858039.1 IS110 family transposase [Acidithiobacillus ferrooxidans]MBU2861220.1 IS110 family transposase [Acidithiobacillus ferrooxidans]